MFLSSPEYLPGLLGEAGTKQAQDNAANMGLLGAIGSLLAASGPQPRPIGVGQAIGQAMMNGIGAHQSALNQAVNDRLTGMKLAEMQRKSAEADAVRRLTPSLFRSEVTPGQNLYYGQPTALPTRDDEGNMMPGAQEVPGSVRQTLDMNTLQQLMAVAPESTAPIFASLKSFKEFSQPKYEKLGLGDVLVNQETGKVVAQGNPKEDPVAGEVREAMQVLGMNKPVNDLTMTERGLVQRYITEKKKAGATVVDMREGQAGFKNQMELKSSFRSEPVYKTFTEMQDAFNQVNASLRQENPIGDTAAATKIMKLLDPGSVVRETELGMAMAAAGKLDRLQNYVEMWSKGTKLTPTQRQEFQGLANELYAASAQAYNNKRSEYKDMGDSFGLNSDLALGPAAKMPSIMKNTGKASGTPALRILSVEPKK